MDQLVRASFPLLIGGLGGCLVLAAGWAAAGDLREMAQAGVGLALLGLCVWQLALLRQRVGALQDRVETGDQSLRAICQLGQLGLWRRDRRTGMADWSPEACAILGLSTPTPSQAEVFDRVHPDDRAMAKEFLHRALDTLECQTFAHRLIHPQRGERRVRSVLCVEADPAGRPLAIWGLIQDITDRMGIEAPLREREQMRYLSDITSRVSHDFNNLLCAVTLSLDMLAEGGLAPGQGDLVAAARRAAERGTGLTAQLLAFARKRPTRREPVAVNEAVEAVVADLREGAAEPVSFALDLAPDAGCVLADPLVLRAAIEAMAQNAGFFMPAGGSITLRTRLVSLEGAEAPAQGVRPGRYVELELEAGGHIPPELLPRLLEPFFAPRDQRDRLGGTATIGLCVAQGFAEQVGGALHVGNAPEGGTKASLLIPWTDRAPALQVPPPPESPDASWPAEPVPGQPKSVVKLRPASRTVLRGLRILLVEDDAAVRETTEAMLARDGAIVTTAVNGTEAIARLSGEAPFDFLFSDVVLPGGMSGMDIVAACRTLRPGLPSLLASGYVGPEHEQTRILPAGVALLRKPFRRLDLLDAVSVTLQAQSDGSGGGGGNAPKPEITPRLVC